MKKIAVFIFLLFSLQVSSQWTTPDSNGNINNTNSGGIGIGSVGSDWIKVYISDEFTLASQIPSQGRFGLFSMVRTTHTGMVNSRLWGAYILSLNGPGTLEESIGINAAAGNESSATGTVTNAYGIYAGVGKGNGTVTNGYGVYIKDIGATNQFGIYQAGTNDKNYFAGNVGIGTSTPTTKLHIFNGVSNGNTHVFSDLTVEDDDHVMLSLLTPNNKTAYYGFADQDDEYVAGIQYEHSIDRMVFRVNDHTSDMTIINNGNVGIGTASPDSKLTVAGNIHSREVKVTVNAGADFVFEDSYNLPSLEVVQQFINENGHLPEIASAKDMEVNGIHLSEMNIKLLQKIEELTLYAIEQEKKLKEQENINQELEARLIKLEQIINE